MGLAGRAMTALATKVWITRSRPGAAQSAKAIADAGFAPICAPLLTVAAVSTPNAGPADDTALAFTSPNGVRAFTALSDRRDWPAFTVGDATAKAAEQAGFKDVKNAAGSVDDLAAMIIKAAPECVTHLSGVHVAGDLTGALTGAGIEAARTIIYGTQAVTDLPEAVAAHLKSGEALAVTLWSPKAAHIFLTLLPQPYRRLVHCISLSGNIDAVLDGAGKDFASRRIAAAPNAPAMTALLEAVAVKA